MEIRDMRHTVFWMVRVAKGGAGRSAAMVRAESSVSADVAAAIALDGIHARVGGADDLGHLRAIAG